MFLAEELSLSLRKVGAFPIIWATTDSLVARTAREVTPALLVEGVRQVGAWLSGTKAIVTIDPVADPSCLQDIPEKNLATSAQGMRAILNEAYAHGTGWLSVALPTPARERALGHAEGYLEELFWASSCFDPEELTRRGTTLARMLTEAKTVTLETGAGYRLDIPLGEVYLDDGLVRAKDEPWGFGGANIPAGEVFALPRPGLASGEVALDVAYHRGTPITGIFLRIEKGVIVEMSAEQNEPLLRRRFDLGGAASRAVAELGVGINAGIGEPSGYVPTDEKIAGSVHIAFGDNMALGGESRAPFHWDMVSLSPTLSVPEGPVIEAGRFV
jgi:aminopeptidase